MATEGRDANQSRTRFVFAFASTASTATAAATATRLLRRVWVVHANAEAGMLRSRFAWNLAAAAPAGGEERSGLRSRARPSVPPCVRCSKSVSPLVPLNEWGKERGNGKGCDAATQQSRARAVRPEVVDGAGGGGGGGAGRVERAAKSSFFCYLCLSSSICSVAQAVSADCWATVERWGRRRRGRDGEGSERGREGKQGARGVEKPKGKRA
jgi:hypothetical protein